ncbi:acyltransferase [Escherichia coli]
MLLTLQYLRGIASLLVVLYHARGELNNIYSQSNLGDLLFSNGYIGVDLFFMISGFVIMLSTENDRSSFSFIVKRIFRIYPVYLVCLLIAMYILGKPFNAEFIRSLLFINLDLSASAPWFGYAIIFTAWTLMFEIIFYLIFYISMSISWKYRCYICSAFIILMVVLINLYYNGTVGFSGYSSIYLNSSMDHGYLIKIARVLSSPMFFEFVIGMAIYKICDYTNNIVSIKFARFSIITSIVLFSYFYVSGFNGGHGPLQCGLYAAALLFSLVVYERRCGVRYINTLNFFGDISYSLYLTHAIVLSAISTGFLSLYVSGNGFSNIYFIILSSILMSSVLYYTVESHSVRFARRILKITFARKEGKIY